MRSLVLSVVLLACGQPSTPNDQADAARPVSCQTACVNLRTHSCPLGQPTPKGATCEQVCENVQTNNAGAGFPTSCLAKISTCSEADACR
jgi:hypothetical protein